MITDERRAFKRVKLAFNIRYRTLSPERKISGNSSTNNISCGGVFFNTFSSIPIGEILECRISVSGKTDVFRFLSRVVRCESFSDTVVPAFGVAAEFTESFENSDMNLRQILNSR